MMKRGRTWNGQPSKRARAGIAYATRRYKARTGRGQGVAFGPALRGRYAGVALPELKFHDVDLDDAVVTTGAAITGTVIIIPQGVTEKQRVGRKCTIMSIGWRFQIRLPAGTTEGTTSDTVRVMLYLDKQCNGATAAVAQILETDDFQSFNNLANKGRFRTLMDRTFSLSSPSGGTSAAGVDQFGEMVMDDSFYKSCSIPIEYDSTAGALTEIRSNNIGVLLISSDGLCAFVSKFRFRFSDG